MSNDTEKLVSPILGYKVNKKECIATNLLKEIILLDDNGDTSGDYEAKEFLLCRIRGFLNEKD